MRAIDTRDPLYVGRALPAILTGLPVRPFFKSTVRYTTSEEKTIGSILPQTLSHHDTTETFAQRHIHPIADFLPSKRRCRPRVVRSACALYCNSRNNPCRSRLRWRSAALDSYRAKRLDPDCTSNPRCGGPGRHAGGGRGWGTKHAGHNSAGLRCRRCRSRFRHGHPAWILCWPATEGARTRH